MPCKGADDTNRSARLVVRLHPTTVALLKRAAKIQGRSLGGFVADAAQIEAQRVIERTDIIRMSAEEQTRFVDALLSPQPLSRALKRARAVHARRIVKGK